jgi:hypothetical protein
MPTQRLTFASALALLLLMAGPAAGEVKKAGSVKTGKKAPPTGGAAAEPAPGSGGDGDGVLDGGKELASGGSGGGPVRAGPTAAPVALLPPAAAPGARRALASSSNCFGAQTIACTDPRDTGPPAKADGSSGTGSGAKGRLWPAESGASGSAPAPAPRAALLPDSGWRRALAEAAGAPSGHPRSGDPRSLELFPAGDGPWLRPAGALSPAAR